MAAPGYTAEEHAAAWAAYYAQQGYDAATIAAMTGGSADASGSGTAAAGIPSAYTTIETPAAGSSSSKNKKGGGSRAPAGLQTLDGDLSAMYLPSSGKAKKDDTHNQAQQSNVAHGQGANKRETVIRKSGGKVWEDATLLDWDPKWFRLFVGDVSNDVNERTLDAAFSKYPSYCRSKVVRDRLSEKAKYGFIAFSDPEDFLRAWKENDGKYIGNRPIRLSKVKDDKYGSIETVSVSGRKAKQLDKLRKNHGKPLDGRPVPF